MELRRSFIVTALLLITFSSLFAQTRVPSGSQNWLSSAGDTANGDIDGINVFFFEIPDSVTSPIYFAVQDPGVNNGNPQDQTDMVAGESMTFTLVGGEGTYSSPSARKYKYTTTDVYLSGGTQLDQKVYSTANGNATDTGWTYFNPVYPSEGEHIGNKYYFKIVAEASAGSNFKNGYRFDASFNNGSTPTGISSGEVFAYSWCVVFRADIDDIWDFHPFVPEGAGGLGKYIIVGAWDFDPFGGEPTVMIYDKEPEGAGTALTIDAASDDTDNASISIAADEDNGTWRVRVSEVGSVGYPNTSELWSWENNSAVADGEAGVTDGTEPNESTDTMYRVYASSYNPPDPDHIATSAEDGTAIDNGMDIEKISFQVVDSDGNPLPYQRDIYVDVSAFTNVTIEEKNNNADVDNPTVVGATSTVVTTDVSGVGWITISRTNTTDGTVTVTPVTDGSNGSSTLPGTNETVDVVFADLIPPSISSANNLLVDVGTSPVALPDVTVTEGDTGNITVAEDIRIRIPDSLDAVFDTGATVTTSVSGGTQGDAATGATYESGDKVAVIDVITNDFDSGRAVTISGLEFASANSVSSGRLQLSFDGGSLYPVEDDKVYAFDDLSSKKWYGTVDSDWSNANNWDPAGVPVNGDSVLIKNVSTQPVLSSATANALADLTIEAGATLDLAGYTLYASAFENQGTLIVNGSEDVSNFTLDTDSGEVEYSGGGTTIAAWSGYHDLRFSAGTWTLAGTVTVGDDLTIDAGDTLDSGNFDIAVSGDWNNQGSYSSGTETVSFTDSAKNSTITGSTSFSNLLVPSSAAGKTLYFQAGATQTVTADLTITGTSGNEILLRSTAPGTQWTIRNNTATQDIFYTDVQDSNVDDASSGGDLLAAYSTDSGGNDTTPSPAWNFNPTLTWTGATSSDWNVAANWSPSVVPDAGSAVVIPDVAIDPVLTSAVTITDLTLQDLSRLSLAGFDLTVSGTFEIQNNGTLALQGAETVSLIDTNSGTIAYVGGAAGQNSYTGLPTVGSPHNHLIFDDITDGDDIWSLSAPLSVGGDLTITSGTLALVGNNLSPVSGAFQIAAGGTLRLQGAETVDTIDTNGGTVHYVGAGGANAYPRLAAGTVYQTLVFDAAGGDDSWTMDTGPVTVGGALTVSAGELITGAFSLSAGSLSGSGTVSGGAGDIDVDGAVTVANLAASGATTYIGGNFTSVLTHNNGLIVFDTTAGSTISATGNYNNVSFAANKSLGEDLTALGTVTVSAGTLTTGAYSLSAAALTVDGILDAAGQGAADSLAVTGSLSGSGTVSGGAGDIDVDGAVTVANLAASGATTYIGGDFSSALTHQGGLIVLDTTAGAVISNSGDFNDLTMIVDKTLGAPVNVTGTLTVSGGILDTATFDLTAATLDHQAAGSEITGSTGTVSVASASLGRPITKTGGNISFTGGAVALTAAVSLDTGAASAGDVALGSSVDGSFGLTVTSGTGTTTVSGVLGGGPGLGALSITGPIVLSSSITTADSSIDLTGNVVITGASPALDTGAGGGTVTFGGTVNDDGGTRDLSVGAGTGNVLFTGTVGDLGGAARPDSFTITGNSIAFQAAVDLAGSLTTTGAAGQQAQVSVGGDVTQAGSWSLQDNNLTVLGDLTGPGTLTAAAAGAAEQITVGGSFTPGAFTAENSVVVLNGATSPVSLGGLSYFDLTINKSAAATVNSADALTVTNTLSLSGGIWAPGAFTHLVAGNWDCTAITFQPAGGTIRLTSTDPTITQRAANYFSGLSLDAGGGLYSSLDVNGTLTLTSGTLDANAGAGGPYQTEAAGDVDLAGGTLSNAGTFLFDGASNLTSGSNAPFAAVTVTGSLTLNDNMDVNGLLTVSGALDDGGNGLYLSAAADFTGGNFTATGTAVFDGTTNLTSPANAFNNVELGTGGAGPVSLTTDNLMEIDGTFTIGDAVDTTLDIDSDTLRVASSLDLRNLDSFSPAGSTLFFDGGAVQDLWSAGFSLINVTLNGSGLTLQDNMDVNGVLTVSAGTLTDNAQTMNLAGNVSFSGTGVLAATGTAIFDGATILTSGSQVFNIVTLAGAADLTAADAMRVDGQFSFSVGANLLDITGQTLRVAGDFDLSNLTTFTVTGSSVIFDGGTSQNLTSGGKSFNNFTVNGAGGVVLQDPLTALGDLTIDAGSLKAGVGGNNITISGSWFNNAVFDAFTPNGNVVTFNGGTAETLVSGGADPNFATFSGLTVNKAGGSLTVTGDLLIGGVLDVSNGSLDASGDHITYAGTSWNVQTTATGALFNQSGSGRVTFTNIGPVEITGDNTFYELYYTQTGGELNFEAGNNRTQTILSDFYVVGAAGSQITLDSTAGGTPPYSYANPPAAADQWIIEIDQAGGATATITEVLVYRSYAIQSITPDSTCVDGTGNYNWLFIIPIAASWCEDIDGDGRLDRIRARVRDGIDLYDDANTVTDFSAVTAEVEGFPPVSGADFSRGDVENEFYFALAERNELDSDATPRWRLTANSNDPATGLIGIVGGAMVEYDDSYSTTIDRAAPAIGYTLAVAGKDEIFVHLSEFARRAGGGVITAANFSFDGAANVTGLTRVTTDGAGGTKEFLLLLDGLVTAEEIYDGASGAGVFNLIGSDLDDMVTVVWPVGTVGPAPAGGDDLYLAQASPIARVSDLGLGMTGAGIIQPVYAWNDPNAIQRDASRGGIGRIERVDYGSFDSSGWLQDQDIHLQVALDLVTYPAFPGTTANLYWDTSVGAAYTKNGLWLPPYNPPDQREFLCGLIPVEYPSAVLISDPSPGTTPRNYPVISASNPRIRDNTEFQFFFEDSNGLLYARVGDSSASNWYRSVRPWSFLIRNVRQQTAQVSILDNVINPHRGDKVELHYILEKGGRYEIKVFTLAGDYVAGLYRGYRSPGEYTTAWDGRNRAGDVVARGIYFVRVVGPDLDEMRKVLVVR